jgi:NAD(P)-dependent dehydrogenase (short-subunit alcohol dehydrogenase family)
MGALDGKVAVVTGSTSGIGRAIASTFAKNGARVVVSGRRRDRGTAVAGEIKRSGGSAVFCRTDVAVPADCRALIERAVKEFGGVDILVNNAGIFPRAEIEETTPELWDEIFNVNVRGAFFCCQAAIPLMKGRGGGTIINIGSGHPFTGYTALTAYGISKGALYTMTRRMAIGLARDRIRVNWITVGWVLTEKELEVQAGEGKDVEALEKIRESLPMGQMSTEADVADACLYLAGPSGERITGTDILASAGMTIHL